MINLQQVQDDVYGLLMSAPQLRTVNIVQERKFIMDSQLDMDAVWQTVRNGCSGDGLLIEVPDVLCDSDGVSGPPQSVELSFVSFQNGDAAFNPADVIGLGAGGGLFAEQIEQYLLDALQLQAIGGLGTLRVVGRFSGPARDYPGINARRTKIMVTPKQTGQTPRTATIQKALNAGLLTLTCATPGSQIIFTLDGSFPSDPGVAVDPLSVTQDKPQGNPINAASILYAGPFPVQSGQCVRAAAYAPQFNNGEILNYKIP
jgi:hypothetical protein